MSSGHASFGVPVYVYGLVDPRDQRIRYVGQTRNLASRLACHVALARAENWRPSRKDRWIAELEAVHLAPRIAVLQTCMDGDATGVEDRWISSLAKMGWLLNEIGARDGRARTYSAKLRTIKVSTTQEEHDLCSSAASIDGMRLDDWVKTKILKLATDSVLRAGETTKGS